MEVLGHLEVVIDRKQLLWLELIMTAFKFKVEEILPMVAVSEDKKQEIQILGTRDKAVELTPL